MRHECFNRIVNTLKQVVETLFSSKLVCAIALEQEVVLVIYQLTIISTPLTSTVTKCQTIIFTLFNSEIVATQPKSGHAKNKRRAEAQARSQISGQMLPTIQIRH